MLEVDRIAIEETGPNLFQMMENAGRNLALEAISMLGEEWHKAAVVVVAGTGGNGGGGLTAGRHLRNHGGNVAAIVTDIDRLGEVPGRQLELFLHSGGELVEGQPQGATLVIDAVIGYSLKGAPRGRALALIGWANASGVPVLSLDVPSGIDASTGEAPGAAIVATRTMTLALPKHGLCAPQAGELVLADIGIPAEVYARLGRPEAGAVFNGRYRVPLHRSLGIHE